MWFDPLPARDVRNLKAGFLRMFNACSRKGGTKFCICSSIPGWIIKDPKASVQDTFYCLPKACRCRDNSVEQFKLWVI